MKRLITVVLVAEVIFAAEGYHILNKIKIGGTAGWDFICRLTAMRTASTPLTAGSLKWSISMPASQSAPSRNSTMHIM